MHDTSNLIQYMKKPAILFGLLFKNQVWDEHSDPEIIEIARKTLLLK